MEQNYKQDMTIDKDTVFLMKETASNPPRAAGFYNSIPIKSHFSLVISSSEKALEEVLTDEKLPHRTAGPPTAPWRGISVCTQWARVISSKPTQPRSRTRPRRPSAFRWRQITKRSQAKHSVASSIRAISPCFS